MSVAVAAGILAVPVVINGYRDAEAARLALQNGQLQRKMAAQRVELASLTAQANRALVQFQRAEALRSKRAWSAVLALVAQRMPPGCWLTSIASDPAAPGRTSRRVGKQRSSLLSEREEESALSVTIDAPRMLKISGFAADAAEPYQFVKNLKKAAVFSDVVLEASHSEAVLGGSYFRFDLACEW